MNFEDFVNHLGLSIRFTRMVSQPQCDFVLYKNYDGYYSIEKLKEALDEIKKGRPKYTTQEMQTQSSQPKITIQLQA